ncbi:cytochrome P450 [Thozetella sp. PMI_491]|nr:cytochrome P450 [Thozetella sp. PMI_491]
MPVLAILPWLVCAEHWSASVLVLLAIGFITALARVTSSLSFPQNSPKLVKFSDWPILGALQFFFAPYTFWLKAIRQSSTGNFSFYVGKRQVVGISRTQGRKTFFENANLKAAEAERMDKILPRMVSDTNNTLKALLVVPLQNAISEWRVTNPFNSFPLLVFQNMIRIYGPHDVADDPAILRSGMRAFKAFENATSPLKIIFPWLITPKQLLRLFHSARIYLYISMVIWRRKNMGIIAEDVIQYFLDRGTTTRDIVTYVIGYVIAAQTSTSVVLPWIPFFLAQNPEWLARARAEVDSVVTRHRITPTQSPADVLATLDTNSWQTEFPLIDLCLRETIRIVDRQPLFRLNCSGMDIPIGDTGEVVPNGAFMAWHKYELHMDPTIFRDPQMFDPGRYLPDRTEDKKVPNGYLGWGAAVIHASA